MSSSFFTDRSIAVASLSWSVFVVSIVTLFRQYTTVHSASSSAFDKYPRLFVLGCSLSDASALSNTFVRAMSMLLSSLSFYSVACLDVLIHVAKSNSLSSNFWMMTHVSAVVRKDFSRRDLKLWYNFTGYHPDPRLELTNTYEYQVV